MGSITLDLRRKQAADGREHRKLTERAVKDRWHTLELGRGTRELAALFGFIPKIPLTEVVGPSSQLSI